MSTTTEFQNGRIVSANQFAPQDTTMSAVAPSFEKSIAVVEQHSDLHLRWILGPLLFVPTVLWVNNVIQDSSGYVMRDWILEGGRILGLWASVLLLVQLFFMSRVPFIEQNLSKDKIVQVHRWAGFTSFWMLLGHIVLTIIGDVSPASGIDLGSLWHSLATMTTQDGGVLMAEFGTVLLCVVIATSVRAAMRKLRYESWHLLHLYAYVGVLFALPHQLWSGRDFTSNVYARIYWWGLWGLVVATVLAYRVIVPIVRSYKYDLRVGRIDYLGANVYRAVITGRNLEKFAPRMGQWINVRFLDKSYGWTRGNPFSLSRISSDGLEFIFSVVGEGTEKISRLQPGVRVLAEGPYGNLWSSSSAKSSAPVVMIATGSGIAPLLPVLQSTKRDTPVIVLHRIRDLSSPYWRELMKISAERGGKVRIVPLVGSRSDGWLPIDNPQATSPTGLLSYVPRGWELTARFLVCGQRDWVRKVTKDAKNSGVQMSNLHTEAFGW